MQIILRGKKVRTTVITKSLSKTAVDFYRPSSVSFNNHFCVLLPGWVIRAIYANVTNSALLCILNVHIIHVPMSCKCFLGKKI